MAEKRFKFFGPPRRLDKFLAEQLPDLSRAISQRLILEGKARVDGQITVKPSLILRPNQEVALDFQPARLKPQPQMRLEKVFENAEILVINKPPGLVVHPAPGRANIPSVAGAALASIKNLSGVGESEFRPGIVHRLDADTSGLLIIAKTPAAYEYYKKAFASRQIEKKYLALVHGAIAKPHGLIDQKIGRNAGSRKLRAGIGRPALTEYWVEGFYNNGVDNYTLIRIQLHTGRTHQIRVHFSSLGHPVAGDSLYGGRYKKIDQDFFPRQFLHAYYLKIPLIEGGFKELQIDLPKDLKRAIAKLEITN